MHVSISEIGIYIPNNFMSLDKIAKLSSIKKEKLKEKITFNKKPILACSEKIITMAEAAISQLQQKLDDSLCEVDLIIYCSTGILDHYFWSPA